MTKSVSLKPKLEIGILFGTSGDVERLDAAGTRDPKLLVEVCTLSDDGN
jgi:hypothetical protein